MEELLRTAVRLAAEGRREEAEALLRRLVAEDPGRVEAHLRLARTAKYEPGDGHVRQMELLLEERAPGSPEAATLHLALAKAFEDLGQYEKSFEHALAANAIIRAGVDYSSETATALFSDLRSAFDRSAMDRFDGAGCPDDTPIFVVGMPRSGTSLTEQILASHPEVFGAGELDITRRLLLRAFEDHAATSYVQLMERITRDGIARLGEAYVRELRRHSHDARFIVDKMPGNDTSLGLLRLALPNASLVLCSRDPADNCLSIFGLAFRGHQLGYAYELRELAHYYRLHHGLMEHWRRLFGAAARPSPRAGRYLFDNRYEDLVFEPERQVRKLLAFCGLEWNPGCLEFHRTARVVKTASRAQVRQPLFATAVGRAKRFGEALRPLLDALEEDAPGAATVGARAREPDATR